MLNGASSLRLRSAFLIVYNNLQRRPRRFLQYPLSVFLRIIFRVYGIAKTDVRISDPLFRRNIPAERNLRKHFQSPRLISIRAADCPITRRFAGSLFSKSTPNRKLKSDFYIVFHDILSPQIFVLSVIK